MSVSGGRLFLAVMGTVAAVIGGSLIFLRRASAVSFVPKVITVLDVHPVLFDQGITPTVVDDVTWQFQYPQNLSIGSGMSGEDIRMTNGVNVNRFEFDAQFSGDTNAASFDEMAVFCTNTLQYNGTEFGMRRDMKDGYVYAYTQNNGPSFQQVRMFLDDGLEHHYDFRPSGTLVQYYIDGALKTTLSSLLLQQYPAGPYWVTALAHRYSSGWISQSNWGFIIRNITLNNPVQ